MTTNNRAYDVGYEDGLAWDLDGYDSRADVEAETDWASPTINALGPNAFARHIGISPDAWGTAEWQSAVDAYNRGCREGALSDGATRTGLQAAS